jgi:hypothetical protein
MPTLETYASSRKNIKALVLGDSGGGKTGALAALANDGYNLRILDFDAGAVDILLPFVEPEFRKNVEIIVLTDKMKARGATMVPDGKPTAFAQSLALLTHWRYLDNEDGTINTLIKPGIKPDIDYGPLETWGHKDIIVLDSFSHMGEAALRYVLAMNARSGTQPHQSDWGEAQRMLTGVLDKLNAPDIPCQIIVNTHVTLIQKVDDEGKPIPGIPMKALPMALGQALSPKVGSYFNTMLLCKTLGRGTNAKRQIHCQPEGLLELKIPTKNPPKPFPIETGLKSVFDLILGAE